MRYSSPANNGGTRVPDLRDRRGEDEASAMDDTSYGGKYEERLSVRAEWRGIVANYRGRKKSAGIPY